MSNNSQKSTIQTFIEWLKSIRPKSDILKQPIVRVEEIKKPYKSFKKFR